MTLHAWAGVGLANDTGNKAIERVVGQIKRNKEVYERWTKTQILVIDEVSMLSDNLFDFLSVVGVRVRQNPRPFGGLQLILCGDFFQLPPVG